jgi:hypothetical protein
LAAKGGKFMSTNNIEMMKKIIEEKKKVSSEQGSVSRPDKVIGKQRKASRSTKKTGGLFDR